MPDTHYDKTVLLLPLDGQDNSTVFNDWSLNSKEISVFGDAKTVTSQSKYYGSSGYFDGVDSILTMPDSMDFNFGSDDFTIEAWVRPSTTTTSIICAKRTGVGFGPFQLAVGANAQAYLSTTGSGWTYQLAGAAITLNTWNHVAMTRSNSTLNIFVNGVGAAAPVTNVTGSLTTNSVDVSIGAISDGTLPFAGYINDVRVTKGVARYVEDFVPPAQLIKTIRGTVKDDQGLPCIRDIVLHERTTSKAFRVISEVDGTWKVHVPDALYYAVAFDVDDGASYNALVKDRVVPE